MFQLKVVLYFYSGLSCETHISAQLCDYTSTLIILTYYFLADDYTRNCVGVINAYLVGIEPAILFFFIQKFCTEMYIKKVQFTNILYYVCSNKYQLTTKTRG